MTPAAHRAYAAVLGLLLAAFLFRVGAQFVQWLRPTPLLPPFEAWHSTTLPYGALLALQAATALVMATIVARVATCVVRSNARWGKGLLAFGLLYFVFKLFRLVAGLTFWSDHPWWGAVLASVFHLVLAAFVLVLALYHLRGSRRRPSEG